VIPPLPDPAPGLELCFLPTDHGDILVTAWLPPAGQVDEWLLLVPPFAEEMNKSRRMLAMLARQVAATGRGVLLPDLSGTGDSWGDFGDARHDLWLDDLEHAVRWAGQRGGTVTAAAGLRLGGLLAMELAHRVPSIRQLLLWQPAVSGADALTQFLRLKTAAGLTGSGDAGETLDSIRRRLGDGEPVEIAGYELAPELYAAIHTRRLAELVPPAPPAVEWFHVSRQPASRLPDALASVAGKLAALGCAVQTHVVQGDAFWSTTEIAVCEELVALTAARLGA